ncbi:MAG: hypothetical protein C0622_03455 [Desulfuromonas sp.]|nr:MAG: hypothetical protein C0622_03455 [Desulfuromonas sp.]
MKKNRLLETFTVLGSALTLLMLLSGCAGTGTWVWEHEQQLDAVALAQARSECEQLARREADRLDFFYPPYSDYPFYRQGFHPPYYQPWIGWSQHSRFFRYQDNFDRFFRICMTAKGWHLVKRQQEKQTADPR